MTMMLRITITTLRIYSFVEGLSGQSMPNLKWEPKTSMCAFIDLTYYHKCKKPNIEEAVYGQLKAFKFISE